MSTYYLFYLGYTTNEDDKVHLFGPFDKFGKKHPMVVRSRSFIYEMDKEFAPLNEENMGDDVKEAFGYKMPYEDKVRYGLHYLKANELPDPNYIRSGYFLLDEVIAATGEDDPYETYFTEWYSPTEYSMRLSNAVMKDDKDEIARLKEFVFFSYPDYCSKDYISSLIYQYISWNGPFDRYSIESTLKDNNAGELKDMIILMNIS